MKHRIGYGQNVLEHSSQIGKLVKNIIRELNLNFLDCKGSVLHDMAIYMC